MKEAALRAAYFCLHCANSTNTLICLNLQLEYSVCTCALPRHAYAFHVPHTSLVGYTLRLFVWVRLSLLCLFAVVFVPFFCSYCSQSNIFRGGGWLSLLNSRFGQWWMNSICSGEYRSWWSAQTHNLMFFWPCIMNWLYINYQLLCTDCYLFIKYCSPLHVSSLKCSSHLSCVPTSHQELS